MNNKSSDFHPRKLEQEIFRTVIRDDRLYYLYTDALALTLDLVSEFSAEQEKPRLTSEEIAKHIDTIQHELSHQNGYLLSAENPPVNNIAQNIAQNYDLAWEIRNFAEHAETASDRLESERAATQFSRGLLQIYTTIRTTKHAIEPDHANSD